MGALFAMLILRRWHDRQIARLQEGRNC